MPLEQRQCTRRQFDRAMADYYKTFSTPYCHHCLEQMADGALLLDGKMQVLYATAKMEEINQQYQMFVLTPRFAWQEPSQALRFDEFTQATNTDIEPLCLMFGGHGQEMLCSCIRLPPPANPDAQVAHYLIKLRYLNHFNPLQWHIFIRQYKLTQAEARLCRSLADGYYLNEYCEKWRVAASTARSQLKAVFAKTDTHRQADLLRLISLFTQT